MMNKKRDMYGPPQRLLTVLVTGLLAFGLMPLAAADVSVTRDLPDEPVYPGTQITVTLNQIGFYITGVVYETLPDGFTFRGPAVDSGGEYTGEYTYDRMTNDLSIDFQGETTVQYLVEAGTADQIENAFSGTWKTVNQNLDKISGEVEGDTTLILATEPTPTPTPSNGGGGGGGGGDGGGTTPTPTTSPAPTTSISPSPGASPGVSPTPSSGPTTSPGATPTASSTISPSTSPTAKPGIPGFELIFALAGLLAIAQWLWRRRNQ